MKFDFLDEMPMWVLGMIGFLALLAFLWVWMGSCLRAGREATERGRSGRAVGWAVFFTWPVGLVIWDMFKPRPLPKAAPPLPPPQRRCSEPGCAAAVHQTGRILGKAIYLCEAGHEFTDAQP